MDSLGGFLNFQKMKDTWVLCSLKKKKDEMLGNICWGK